MAAGAAAARAFQQEPCDQRDHPYPHDSGKTYEHHKAGRLVALPEREKQPQRACREHHDSRKTDAAAQQHLNSVPQPARDRSLVETPADAAGKARECKLECEPDPSIVRNRPAKFQRATCHALRLCGRRPDQRDRKGAGRVDDGGRAGAQSGEFLARGLRHRRHFVRRFRRGAFCRAIELRDEGLRTSRRPAARPARGSNPSAARAASSLPRGPVRPHPLPAPPASPPPSRTRRL